MSRQMSPSQQSRRVPWDEHGPNRASAGHYGRPLDWKPIARNEERRFGEDMFPEAHRRSSPSPQDHFWRQRNQEGNFPRKPSPRRDFKDHHVPRSSRQQDGGFNADRQRRGFREDFQNVNSRARSQCSPPRFLREPLLLLPRSHSEHSQEAPPWRRDEWRGQGQLRDTSPRVRSEEQRGSRREGNVEGLNRSRQREDVQPPLKRPRREMDGQHHSGFRRDNKDFGDRCYSAATVDRAFHRETPDSGTPHFTEHGFQGTREPLDNGGQRDFHLRQQHADAASSSQEQFRNSNSGPDGREDSRKHHFPDKWGDGSERKRSLPPQERANFARYDRQGTPTNHRGRGGPHLARGRVSHMGNRTNFLQSSRSYQNSPREEPRAGYRSQRETSYPNAEEEGPSWTQDDRRPKQVQPASLERGLHRSGPDVNQPRPHLWEESESKNVTVVTEETLTIKVDMSRPILHTSSPCYSAERQLSIDLVNVGRRRPDFLPEAPGAVPESDGARGGAFAQEIITLVHNVKELYFKGNGITLNKRFSAPQYSRDETATGLTLNQRFSSKQYVSVMPQSVRSNMNTAPSHGNIQPLFPALSGAQTPHGPGDLRHDLERRRQKRLEGVTITIPGSGPPSPVKVRCGAPNVMLEDERDYRRDGNTGPRRGGPYRTNAGPMSRVKNQQHVRMQNCHNNGLSW
ncbi:BCLAF1 and THRAP3 family member 3 isoform X2 [Syngnathus scovelli]|uniref:BCLAF1 and THRAP3 family member 3 isoform X2 n=1 Tax=Syngnathus scovelli TaxID=161590 RepID=UPI00210F458A|nr:BCLAF1 and THRAP3 family member 3 isoform X2 [Syngnathus scovelli]